ncbi:ribonuclease III [Spiroplasma eriocheiris]|uniref:ribonuclease III n=1 Tax=Spiroplasma eriocheiris TaxID=315358 RepID=UPI0009A4761A|nr:ribonuclease III [Spiroplasma eriocheiris]AHF57318.1 ribonuclease III [Spiroplasma eriocheiris CCTCC M 207170]
MSFENKTPENLVRELKDFFQKYNIEIKNGKYYLEALTHNSYANENNLSYTYQRLEFLGDAILAKEISLYLFRKYPNKNEGEITNLRSKVVRESTLAELVRKMNLAQFILLGKGEIKTKEYEKDRILADIYESMIAALYLDTGEETTRHFISDTLIDFAGSPAFLDKIRDYKTELQEFLQASDSRELEYKLIDEIMPPEGNKILYRIVAEIDGVRYGEGQGYTHKEAEQIAARNALNKLAKNTIE